VDTFTARRYSQFCERTSCRRLSLQPLPCNMQNLPVGFIIYVFTAVPSCSSSSSSGRGAVCALAVHVALAAVRGDVSDHPHINVTCQRAYSSSQHARCAVTCQGLTTTFSYTVCHSITKPILESTQASQPIDRLQGNASCWNQAGALGSVLSPMSL
jgi:hypothetical protein